MKIAQNETKISSRFPLPSSRHAPLHIVPVLAAAAAF